MTDPHVLSLWPALVEGRQQNRSRCARWHTTIRYDVACRVVTALTVPDATVLDVYGGAGAVARAAVEGRRHVVALTSRRCCWDAARSEVNGLKQRGILNDGMVITPSRRQPAELLPKVDLMLLGLRADRRPRLAVDELLDLLRIFSGVLVVGGYAAIVTPPVRLGTEQVLVDVPTRVAQTGRLAGLIPVARLVTASSAFAYETITVLRACPAAADRADALPFRRQRSESSLACLGEAA